MSNSVMAFTILHHAALQKLNEGVQSASKAFNSVMAFTILHHAALQKLNECVQSASKAFNSVMAFTILHHMHRAQVNSDRPMHMTSTHDMTSTAAVLHT
eukprot:1161829-Pelagomonas_calceolata.AAC.16